VTLLLKALLFVCIGTIVLAGAQALWLSLVRQQLSNQIKPASVELNAGPTIMTREALDGIVLKVDPSVGKDGARGTTEQLARETINAGRTLAPPARRY
jgi:hypothetical protein